MRHCKRVGGNGRVRVARASGSGEQMRFGMLATVTLLGIKETGAGGAPG